MIGFHDTLLVIFNVVAICVVLIFSGTVLVLWRRRQFRFRLRTAVIAGAGIAAVLAVFQQYAVPALGHRWAIYSVHRSGGAIVYADETENDAVTVWFDAASKEANPFREVDTILLDNDAAIEATADHLAHVPELRQLWLGAGVSDRGLEKLSNQRACVGLSVDLCESQVTKTGLKHLRKMKPVGLMLNTVNIGVLELDALTEIDCLERICLVEEGASARPNRISRKSWETVAKLPQLKELRIIGIGISDADLRHFEKAANLRFIALSRTAVSHDAVNRLRQALPNAEIEYHPKP